MLGELGYTVAAEAARIDEALEATKNADFRPFPRGGWLFMIETAILQAEAAIAAPHPGAIIRTPLTGREPNGVGVACEI